MKQSIKIEIPVTEDMEITIDPPCVYCGNSISNSQQNMWKKTLSYQIQRWGFSRKFNNPMLVKVLENNKFVQEKITFKLPYCDTHINSPKIFNKIDMISIISGLCVSLVIVLLIFINRVKLDISGLLLFSTFFSVPIPMLGIFYLVGMGIKSILAKSDPALRDLPFSFGNYGVHIDNVRCDPGKTGVGPISYFLPMGFVNAEIGKKFIRAYPQAKIIKGAELLE